MEGIELSRLQQLDASGKIAPLAKEDLPRFRTEIETFAASLADNGFSFADMPFELPDSPDPQELGEATANLFFRLADIEGPKLSLIWRIITDFASDHPALLPLRDAGEMIAADYDRGLHAGTRNTYHNRQHTVETLVCAHLLTQLDLRQEEPLSAENRLILLISALIHDWNHDGSEKNGLYFRLEKRALEAAKPYFTHISPDQLLCIDLIVRASDLSGPHTYARQAVAWQRIMARMSRDEPRPTPPATPEGMEILSTLFQPQHAVTAEIAAMLRDADLMPMAGLTPDYAAVISSRLRDEWARPFAQAEYVEILVAALARPRTQRDERPQLAGEPADQIILFGSRMGLFFNANLLSVINGHARLMQDMGEEPVPEEEAATPEEEPGIDLSMFEEAKSEAAIIEPAPSSVTPETIDGVRRALSAGGFFEMPPFTSVMKSTEKLLGGSSSELLQRISFAENTADTLQRLHGVSGPVVSAVIAHLFDTIGLRVDDNVYRAATAIAREIDEGRGAGTTDDEEGGERNPYHNSAHILDMLLLCDLLGQRATQRKAPASSPLARGLLLLAALICHWHHTGKGNKVDGVYHHFYLQDRALAFAEPHLGEMSKELRQSLTIMVRSTDGREPYAFCRAVYAFHVGLGHRPDVAPNCESLTRLLGDPALCTLVARLNDVVFVPFAGLSAAYSARAMVQMGREIGMPIDFDFVRKNLIGPMLSRPPYPGETPLAALMVNKNRVASFTSAEGQAIFNPAMHALLLADYKRK